MTTLSNSLSQSSREYVAVSTFKCEGCGLRFPAEKIFRPNYKFQIGSAVFAHGDKLANYVCSRHCSGIATRRKEARGQTLQRFLEIYGLVTYLYHQNGRQKLTAAGVRSIRDRAAAGESQIKLGKIFKVSASHIWRVVHYKDWKDVV